MVSAGKYAVVYYHGRPRYLGLYGSPESKVAYSRFIAELQANPTFLIPSGEKRISVRELTAAFLDYTEANSDYTEYSHCRVVVLDFLDKLYGDDTPVEDFKPRSLKLVRNEMIQSRRFCRRIVNRYTHRIVSIFAWGVENELVQETTWRAMKTVKSLPKGYNGTFDNEERQPVSDDAICRTLPFMPPTLRAMVQLQRILGMRPNEIFKMRVGDIDTTRGNDLWYYVPGSYKTSRSCWYSFFSALQASLYCVMVWTPELIECIQHLFPRQRVNVTIDYLTFFQAVQYIAENGCQWRVLPQHFGNWNTIYYRFRYWADTGVFDSIEKNLYHKPFLLKELRHFRWTVLMLRFILMVPVHPKKRTAIPR